MSDGLVEELCDGDVVLGLGEELGHGDIIVEEFRDGRVQVLGQGGVHELGDSHVVGGVHELGHGNIVASLVEEFGDGDVVVFEELCHRCVEVLRQVNLMLKVVSGENFIEEFGDRDVVAVEVLGHSDAILLAEELRDSDVVVFEELSDGPVEELGHRDVVLFQELGQAIVCGFRVHELCHRNIVRGSKVLAAGKRQSNVELGRQGVRPVILGSVFCSLVAAISILPLALTVLSVLLVALRSVLIGLMAAVPVMILALTVLSVLLVALRSVLIGLMAAVPVMILALTVLSVLVIALWSVLIGLMTAIPVMVFTLTVFSVLLITLWSVLIGLMTSISIMVLTLTVLSVLSAKGLAHAERGRS